MRRDRVLADEVVAASRGAAVLAPATPSLLELAALYERCDVVVGGDTGPIHLAAALGVPVIGLYGPKDPAIYAPWDARTGAPSAAIWKNNCATACRSSHWSQSTKLSTNVPRRNSAKSDSRPRA